MLVVLDGFEREARRRRFADLRRLMEADGTWSRSAASTAAARAAGRDEAMASVTRFLMDLDIGLLRADLDRWSRQNLIFGFAGPNGAMFLNQLADGPLASESAALLATLIRPPDGPEQAADRIQRLIEHALYRREQGSQAAAGRAVPFLSWFWWLADPERWPVLWSISTLGAFSKHLGWLPSNLALDQQGELYLAYRDQCLDLGAFVDVEEVAVWLTERDPLLGLDPLLQQRCQRAAELEREPGDNDDEWDLNRTNVRVLLAEMKRTGRSLAADIAQAWGFEVRVQDRLTEFWDGSRKRLRCDTWVAWVPADRSPTARLTLLVNDTGAYLGLDLFANTNPRGWYTQVRDALGQRPTPEGFDISEPPYAAFPDYGSNWRLQARHVPFDELTTPEGLRRAVVDAAATIADNLRFTWTVSGGTSAAPPTPPTPAAAPIGPPVEDRETRIALLEDRVFLPGEFLSGIVEMLEDKGQVVFHGPPGTGKTLVALELAEAITGDRDAVALVQFHPSTGYEDFIEGYRPESREDGTLSYRLVRGPLRLLADQATANPDQTFVLVIDEINRANLPKAFGELLFLLEYRNRVVRPLYRPEEQFALPGNLWIIGTMNTADRSIALVDAALRRRFHFVEFVPDQRGENPVSDVLERWASDPKRAGSVAGWLADFVDHINQELRRDLGGDHLLLGASYFMREPMGHSELRTVWARNIEPLLKDLFFGDPARVAHYRFERVWERWSQHAGLVEEPSSTPS